jgi:hypothetical protein
MADKNPSSDVQQSLDVRAYTSGVMDRYQKLMETGSDRSAVFSSAMEENRNSGVTIRNALRLGQQTVRDYSALRSDGHDHITARERVSEAMAQRFDERGRDSHQQEKQRQQSQGMSL